MTTGPSSYNPDGWAAASEEISDHNLLWRQYVLFVDLYRYYIDLAWKTSIWFYAATGVSLAYFVTHFNSRNHGYLPLLLLFLGAMGIGVLLIFSRVIHYVTQMEKWLEYIAVSLKLPGARTSSSYAGSVNSSVELFFSSRHLVSGSSPTFKLSRNAWT